MKSTIIHAVTGFILTWNVLPAYAVDFTYTAITQAPVANKQGVVSVGRLTWECKGNRCLISGPWAIPAVSACRSLANEVGKLRSYGHPKAQLSPAQIEQCNDEVKIGLSEKNSKLQLPLAITTTALLVIGRDESVTEVTTAQLILFGNDYDVSDISTPMLFLIGRDE